MRMAKRLFPGLESYKLGYLRYHFDLPVHTLIDAQANLHRAVTDAAVTALLFDHLVQEMHSRAQFDDSLPWADQLLAQAAQPVIQPTMPFGKHRGKLMVDVPVDYWQWALANMSSLQPHLPEYDADFAASVETALTTVMQNQGLLQSDAEGGRDAGQ